MVTGKLYIYCLFVFECAHVRMHLKHFHRTDLSYFRAVSRPTKKLHDRWLYLYLPIPPRCSGQTQHIFEMINLIMFRKQEKVENNTERCKKTNFWDSSASCSQLLVAQYGNVFVDFCVVWLWVTLYDFWRLALCLLIITGLPRKLE